ncbi:putative galacturan 1,4-alpha-galacturonidase C [Delitschia confertaspora ATCC 74209]|uniref:galacturonan 1,4-alpha-galacturonidase n=1 Tax=Delitschia confertaspora ATCC 74209 TaxID=1513339 RepID=A0A9P4JWC5_9PLEO|nr:putative galacturan 1,4-alpha-galacturonidase C [Delitschia confertaspora ATCC 74209]
MLFSLIPVLLCSQFFGAFANPIIQSHGHGRKSCTVLAKGKNKDDVPNILKAFKECGNGGTVVFPQHESYWIAQRFNPVVKDVTIEWRGQWTFSDNLSYWRNHSYTVPFQNHRAGFALSGDGIRIDGYGTGGIHGNGDLWYSDEAGTTREGRPMPLVFWNVSDVQVKNFFVKDPQLWAVNIMNGTNMEFENILVNATSTKAPWGTNWVGNTDGFDTMDANNISLTNFYYQGGDDCIAIKPRSYNIHVRNATCHGGNGMAIGSLGQYLEDNSVVNVTIDDVKILRYNEDMHNSAYIKTWVGALVPQKGYESEYKPRGGGWGIVSNITFSNFWIQGADAPPSITQDNGNNGSFSGTSKMLISDVRFVNFTGYLHNKNTMGGVSCSMANPCFGISYENVHLKNGENGTENVGGSCKYIAEGGVHGLKGSGC